MEWLGHPGVRSGLPGHLENPVLAQGDPRVPVSPYGMPPRLKGIIRLFMLETSVCIHKPLWALACLSKLWESFPDGLADVGDVGGTVYPE